MFAAVFHCQRHVTGASRAPLELEQGSLCWDSVAVSRTACSPPCQPESSAASASLLWARAQGTQGQGPCLVEPTVVWLVLGRANQCGAAGVRVHCLSLGGAGRCSELALGALVLPLRRCPMLVQQRVQNPGSQLHPGLPPSGTSPVSSGKWQGRHFSWGHIQMCPGRHSASTGWLRLHLQKVLDGCQFWDIPSATMSWEDVH